MDDQGAWTLVFVGTDVFKQCVLVFVLLANSFGLTFSVVLCAVSKQDRFLIKGFPSHV